MAVLNLNKQDTNFESNVEMKSKSFGIGDASAIIDILRNRMYSMPIQTLVQEYICNGRDASIEAGNFGKKAIKITAPTKLACEFRVRDFGVGLSQDRVENVFTLYGNSTKRNSNNQIGGYGLGAKSAWAYTDSFTVVSFYNGVKTTYLCHVGKDNVGSMDILTTEKTTELNGVEIIVTVKPEDITKFNNAIKRVLSFWNSSSYDLNIVNEKKKSLYKDSLVSIYDSSVDADSDNRWNITRGIYLVVDDVIFPIPKSLEGKISHNSALYIHLKTGEVDIAPSREVVIDNNKVNDILARYKSHLADINKEIAAQKTIDDKIKVGDKYQVLLQSISFPINSELDYSNGTIVLKDSKLSKRITNKNRKLTVDNTHYSSYGNLTLSLKKETIILIANDTTKNVPSKVIHALNNTRQFHRNEYAICLPINNLPQYIIDKVTVLEVDSLPLPPRAKTVRVTKDNSCKEVVYSSYSTYLYSNETRLELIDSKDAFKVPYMGWKDDYKLKMFLRNEGNSVKVYALKKEDFDDSKLLTFDEYVESKAKLERKKIGNVSNSDMQALSKLVNGIDFPIFGSEPKEYYLNDAEKDSQYKHKENAKKLFDNLKREYPLTSYLTHGNMNEIAEYITLKQKSKSATKTKQSA